MIVKPVSRLIQELDAKSFTVIGCPGSDGLGTEALQAFDAAIRGAEGDFIVTLGDVAPLGRDPYYRDVADFIDATSKKPMYVMRGNHDGPDYGEYFGFNNSAVLSEDFVLIMLDNSGRRFSDETLAFMRETMAMIDSHSIIVAFHNPPPNRVTGDSMSRAEWERFEEAVGVWRSRISLLLCSHVHNYFEDEVDGLRLVVTGGGGARIQRNERLLSPRHHALEISVDADGVPVVEMRQFELGGGGSGGDDVYGELESAFTGECRAHVAHLLEAEDADQAGRPNAARLFRAAAESRLRHARTLHRVLRRRGDQAEALKTDLSAARRGSSESKRLRASLAEEARDVLAARAIRSVVDSEAAYAALFEKALGELSGGDDIAENGYYVCYSCGLIFSGSGSPTYCSDCGAPADLIREIQ